MRALTLFMLLGASVYIFLHRKYIKENFYLRKNLLVNAVDIVVKRWILIILLPTRPYWYMFKSEKKLCIRIYTQNYLNCILYLYVNIYSTETYIKQHSKHIWHNLTHNAQSTQTKAQNICNIPPAVVITNIYVPWEGNVWTKILYSNVQSNIIAQK